MAILRQKLVTACVAVLAGGVVTAIATPASAVWKYSDPSGNTCNPDVGSDVTTLPPPRALIMLDRSGSMNFSVDTSCGSNDCGAPYRWPTAVNAIDALTQDLTAPDPDTVEFGLGLFTTKAVFDSTLDISEPVPGGPNNHDPIMNVLNNTGPQGLTPMAQAIDAMKTSSTIQNAPGAAVGVLVTDGEPQMTYPQTDAQAQSLRDQAVQSACGHRAVAPMYVIGFGGDTDTDFNNVLAAAGGTGSCTGGDPCAAGTNQYDASAWTGNCTGAFQATDQQGLINAFSSISSQISCTYPISAFTSSSTQPWDDPNQGCANNYYECINISLGGTTRVYNISDPNQTHVGWEFTSSTHDTIRLLNTDGGADQDYCAKIQSGDGSVINPSGNDVSIKLACMCQQPTGNSCSDTDFCYNDPAGSNCGNLPGACDCPVGTWSCQQGIDACQQDVPCGQALVDDGTSDCTAGQGVCQQTGSFQCTGGPNGDGQGGTLACSVSGDPSQATDEVCDGKDDNCNGVVDDIGSGVYCHVDAGLDANAIASETNRCKIGIASCGSDGTLDCQPLSPMPEVCNGIDDDCDGHVDNLSTSRDYLSSEGMSYPTLESHGAQFAGASCYDRDLCMCTNGHDTIEGADFASYLDAWAKDPSAPNPVCSCGGN